MGRILMLLLLPTAAYLWWRYLKGAPPEVRRKRLQYAVVGGLLVVLMFASLRSGSILGAALGGVGLAILRFLPALVGRYLAHRARTYVSASGAARDEGSRRSVMTRTEALEVLGLSDKADRNLIQERYKVLIKNNHPDHGGSSYLAARINQARDILLQDAPRETDQHQ